MSTTLIVSCCCLLLTSAVVTIAQFWRPATFVDVTVPVIKGIMRLLGFFSTAKEEPPSSPSPSPRQLEKLSIHATSSPDNATTGSSNDSPRRQLSRASVSSWNSWRNRYSIGAHDMSGANTSIDTFASGEADDSLPSIRVSPSSSIDTQLDPLSNIILQAANAGHNQSASASKSVNRSVTNRLASTHAPSPSQATITSSAPTTTVPVSSIYLPDSPSGKNANQSYLPPDKASGSIHSRLTKGSESSFSKQRDISMITNSNTNAKKSGSFFSKLFKSSGRPTQQDENNLNFADISRDEGYKADVLWYVPNMPIRPKYIRVRAHNKANREFSRLFLAQELYSSGASEVRDRLLSRGATMSDDESFFSTSTDADFEPESSLAYKSGSSKSKSAVWSMEFSRDGKYLAIAGEDSIIRIWEVISNPEDRCGLGEEDPDSDSESINHRRSRRHIRRRKLRAYAPVFKDQPVREYFGHTSDVLALSWSKNNFLLSSSMDKTVRLWHPDRSNCLGCFLHTDFVTSIKFHPSDDRFFLSGSLDSKLRLWSIPDEDVAFKKNVSDLITAVAFSPDGYTAIAGCFGGSCLFYETDGLKLIDQIQVKSTRGKNSRGSKITGIEPMVIADKHLRRGFDQETKLLISTNDSRIRMYNLQDRTLDLKFKGHENEQSQIEAFFSDDGRYVISGSEDERTYIWRLQEPGVTGRERQEYEYFHFNKSQVTCAKFVPTNMKRILADSRDPVYDICNPPPVVLKPSSTGEAQEDMVADEKAQAKFNAKCDHDDGNIIVTADKKGVIKVFRQDCAYKNRKSFPELSYFTNKKRMSAFAISPQVSRRESHRTKSINSARARRLSPLSLREGHAASSSPITPTKDLRSGSTTPTAPSRNSSIHSILSYAVKSDRQNIPTEGKELVSCSNCNKIDFKAVKRANGRTLVCSSCGREA